MKIRAIIFDSSVLINIPKQKLQDSFKKMIEYYLPYEKAIKDYQSAFNKFQKGLINETEFFQQAFREIQGKNHKKVIKEHNSERDKLVKPVQGFEVLDTLVKDYKLGLISNMPKEWFLSDAKRLGVNTKHFSSMMFGDKADKPKPVAFKKAVSLIKEKPERCVYVTNDDEEAIGAQEAGLVVVSLGSDAGDMRIESLMELIDLLHEQDYLPKQTDEVRTVSR
jgi:FMN phosphatase YigB (HAD superfamily)